MKRKKPTAPKSRQPAAPAAPERFFKPNAWLAIAVAAVGMLLYANTLHHEYALDDIRLILQNPNVQAGFEGIPDILKTGTWHFDNVNLGYYRPLSTLTFALENEFFPKNPHFAHLVNVLLYACTGYVLCLLLMRIFRRANPVFPFLMALLFIAHPIHTEVVANLKSRDEILAFLFLCLSLYLFLQGHVPGDENGVKTSGWARTVSVAVCFYLALLSKETAAVGLALAPLALYFTGKDTIRQSLVKSFVFLLVLVVFQVQKYVLLGGLSGNVPPDIANYPYALAGAKLPSTFLILLWCVRLTVFPHPLSYDYSYNQIPAATFASPAVLLGVLLAAALVYGSLKNLKNRSYLAFGICTFSLALAPALGFVLLRGGIFAERFLYAPSLGFCIVVVVLLAKLAKMPLDAAEINPKSGAGRLQFAVPLLAVFLLFAVKTISRNPVWHDNMSLFSTDVRTAVNSCQVHRHYGNELIDRGMAEKDSLQKLEWFNKGTAELRKSLKINPHFGDAFFKLGLAYQAVKINADSAIYYYNKAVQEIPDYGLTYNNLGVLYERMGKQELASYYYNKSVEVNPYLTEGINNRDRHKAKTGLDIHLPPSFVNMDSLIRATPEQSRDAQFYFKTGNDFASKGDYANAAASFEKAVQLNPSATDALINLANCYGMLKNYQKCIEVLNKIIAANPQNTQALGNLALTYELMGDKSKAAEYRNRVKQIQGN